MIYLLMEDNYRANVSEFHYAGRSITFRVRLFQKNGDVESEGSFHRYVISSENSIKTILNSKSQFLASYDTLCKSLLEYYKEVEEKIGTIEVENG